MSIDKRKLTYSLAINEGLNQMMVQDKSVFIMGQGVKSPWYVGNTTKDLLQHFGTSRVIDTPVSENAMTGTAVGAALAGMRPVVVYPRMDFMLYAMDPIINEAANWHYMSGGKRSVPIVFWGIINRGGEQAAQHSQTIHAMFAHVPGLKVVMPSTPYDAKGLMISAITEENPVVYIDDRWLYSLEGEVPKEIYEVPIGKGIIRREGRDITLVTSSYMVVESLKASNILQKRGIDVEVIDLRTIKPIDEELMLNSVKKTGRLIVVDGGWKFGGYSAEVSALVSENIFEYLKAPIKRLALPDAPAPASCSLEKNYYRTYENICALIEEYFKT